MASLQDQLIEMGFDAERSKIAATKTSNMSQAIEWLDANADKPLNELDDTTKETGSTEKDASAAAAAAAAAAAEAMAHSFVCNECSKKFRNTAEAEYHASKSGHIDFAESSEELAPLTPEEKAAKLEALRQKMAAKRAAKSEQEKAEDRRNEEIRRKATKESQEAKEELQRKERLKEAEKKRREKQEDAQAKARIKAKIEADKQARREKAEREKARREGRAEPGTAGASTSAASAPAQQKPAGAAHTQARLRLQTPSGNIMKTFPAETTLFEVAAAVSQETGTPVLTFTQNFPRKIFNHEFFGETLKELGLVPSASLIVQ
ncbi:hypothetical protein KEM56_003038 [Ascosphaera pollenicola]|nr:hypothetical protein KEM56_003038 [Ascosphaera pollenicola]